MIQFYIMLRFDLSVWYLFTWGRLVSFKEAPKWYFCWFIFGVDLITSYTSEFGVLKHESVLPLQCLVQCLSTKSAFVLHELIAFLPFHLILFLQNNCQVVFTLKYFSSSFQPLPFVPCTVIISLYHTILVRAFWSL